MGKASAQRESQGASANKVSFGRQAARRDPPGQALPQMAPSADLVTLQRKMQQAAHERAILQRKEDAPSGAGAKGLPTGLKAGVERLSGVSMSDVRVHYNSDKPAQVDALAYTAGKDIHVAPGQEQHVAHEAWHAVQQKQGRVKPTMQMKTGAEVNDDHALEREADVMGARALGAAVATNESTTQSAAHVGHASAPSVGHGGVIQRYPWSYRRMSAEAKKATADVPTKKAARRIYHEHRRLMNDEEVQAIIEISKDQHGKDWLHDRGFMTSDEVDKYARGKNFLDWQDMDDARKLQIATHQYTNNITNTPGHWKGMSVNKERYRIHDQDRTAWEKTLNVPSIRQIGHDHGAMSLAAAEVLGKQQQSMDAMAVLRRVFLILQAGLKYTDDNKRWKNLNEWTAPVAVALSHGGRVNVRIPQVDDARNADQFIDWLLGDADTRQARGITTRLSSTHSAEIGKNKEHRRGAFKETSSKGGYFRGITHYGINLPVGGLGQLDINGKVILPDGRYGHLYIGYIPPTTQKDGALLIGCENDAHGAPGPNPLGHEHTVTAKQGEFSPTGGLKGDKIGAAKGGMKVDMTKMGAQWLERLEALERQIEKGRYTSAQLVGTKLANLNLLE